MTNCFGMTQRN